jgi:hypothetical protein
MGRTSGDMGKLCYLFNMSFYILFGKFVKIEFKIEHHMLFFLHDALIAHNKKFLQFFYLTSQNEASLYNIKKYGSFCVLLFAA